MELKNHDLTRTCDFSGIRVDPLLRERVIDEPVARVEVRERLRGLLGSLQALERELAQVRRVVEGSEELEERLEGRLSYNFV